MTSSTWQYLANDASYFDPSNWTLSTIPGASDTAFFGISRVTSITIDNIGIEVGSWVFDPGASLYNLLVTGVASVIQFFGEGIIVDSSLENIKVFPGAGLDFLNNSTAGAVITNDGDINFNDGSNGASANITNNNNLFFEDDCCAGNANITNNHFLKFIGAPSAGNAIIDTKSSGLTEFVFAANAGDAQLITDAGGTVDFSQSAGSSFNHRLTVGSIAGAGTYLLGGDQLTVGLNGISTNVSGPIDDGGLGGGSGASLVKVGPGTLTLSHTGNTYSGGAILEGGVLALAAVGAAGTGTITFAGKATLKIKNAALTGHVFGNSIDFFAKHDVLDLTGLKFHAGASAKYHRASHDVTVHSGHVTDTLTLVSPQGTHFVVAKDGHGGTKVTLDPPLHAAMMASVSTHDLSGQQAVADLAASANHLGDYLFTA
jgi:autotransporter-associated beta strand protein